MARVIYNDGEEIVYQDHNNAQAAILQEYNDDVLYRLFGGVDGFIDTGFFVSYVGATSVSVAPGRGFQYDSSMTGLEPKYRGLDLDAAEPLTLSSPDGTNPRKDIVVVKHNEEVITTEIRKYKATPSGVISNVTFDKVKKFVADVQVVTGTPAPSPAEPAVPSGYIKIAVITVPAVTGLTGQGNIADSRSILRVAANIGLFVNTLGKTTLVTLNANTPIQTVINEWDAYIQAVRDDVDALYAVGGAALVGYDPTTPGDWNGPPAQVEAALDEAADRIQTLENTASTGAFVQENLDDFVKAPTVNTGLTDNANTNPRGLKFNDLKYIEGIEKIEINAIAPTGLTDADGLPEWEIVSPKKDPRVRLYGDWQPFQLDEQGCYARQVQSSSGAQRNYALVTGVFDSIGIEHIQGTLANDDVNVLVDNVDTGTNLNFRETSVNNTQGGRGNRTLTADASLTGLGMDLHTVKFEFKSTDASRLLYLYGFQLVADGRMQLGGTAYVSKSPLTVAQSTPAAPTVTNKGGRVLRYIDPNDNTIKNTVQNCYVNEKTVASASSGATTLTPNNITGLTAGMIMLITDGANNSELFRVSSVGGGNVNLPAPGLTNNYTSATLSVWGRTLTAVDHSNEEKYIQRHVMGFGCQGNFQGGYDVGYHSPSDNPAIYGFNSDLAHAITNHGSGFGLVQNISGQPHGIAASTIGENWRFEGVFTGLDIRILTGTTFASMKLFLDGVELAAPSFDSEGNYWFKVCSDLPEGSHVLQIENGAGSNDVIWVEMKTYRTKKPSIPAEVQPGNMISDKWKTADYLHIHQFAGTSKKQLSISRGVITQSLLTEAKFIGTWSPTAYTPRNVTDDDQDHCEFSSNTTNSTMERWIYGTGFDLNIFSYNNGGIAQVKIDGLNATTANFPGATAHSVSGQFDFSTGKFDAYSATANVERFGISGLTEGWHKVEIYVTGTKNVSSGDYGLLLYNIYVHGMDYDYVQPTGVHAGGFLYRGALRDLRVHDPIRELELGAPRWSQRLGHLTDPALTTGTAVLHFEDMILPGVETKEGEWLEIELEADLIWSAVAGANSPFYLHIDGVAPVQLHSFGQGNVSNPVANYLYKNSVKFMIPVSPGEHTIVGYWYKASGSGTLNNNVRTRRLIARAVPAMKGAA